jgi:hypothetical protein
MSIGMLPPKYVSRSIVLICSFFTICLAIGFASLNAEGQESRKIATIVRTAIPPTLDGQLNKPEWDNALVIDDFHQYEPIDHGDPSEKSVFYLLYDDENLYIGARLFDKNASDISARQLIQGQSVEADDRIEFVIDPFNNMRTGYKFQVNPNGVRYDGVFEGPQRVNADWDGIWYAESAVDDEGWTSEIVIPFKTLNFNPENPEWGFTIGRGIPRKTEKIAWSSFDREINPGAAGVLSGFSGVQQGKGLDIVPTISMAASRDYVAVLNDHAIKPALDVFYNFTPSLTGVLTLNTDFSATEVDDRQVNLTRFSLFFPEKRDFFLQDSDIFDFGPVQRNFGGMGRSGIPFFSRRIGLSDAGNPVDLNIGGKVTGRAGPLNIGLLAVEQAGYQGKDEFVAETDLFVGRISANIFEESTIGAIFTEGDPRSNLNNSMAGLDFRYRNTKLASGRTVQGAAWYQESNSYGVTADQSSWGMEFELPSSEGLFARFEHQVIEANFNPALGFVNRSGFERQRVWTGYRYRPVGHPWMRTIMTFAAFEHYHNEQDGSLETQNLFYRPIRIESNSGDTYSTMVRDQTEVLLEPFEISEGIMVPVGKYEYKSYELEFEGAQQRTLAPTFLLGTGDFFNGTRSVIEGALDWRPSSRWFLGVGYQYNDVSMPVGDFSTRVIQARTNLAFDARWSWMNVIQYDNVSNTAGINSRLRWNPEAGEDLYIVWNHESDALAAFRNLESRATEFSIKYSRTFRF